MTSDPVRLTAGNAQDFGQILTQLADDHLVLVLTFKGKAAGANFVSPGTFKATSSGPGGLGLVTVSGADLEYLSDFDFELSLAAGDVYQIFAHGVVDITTSDALYRFYFTGVERLEGMTHKLAVSNTGSVAHRIAQACEGHDVVLISTRPGWPSDAFPITASSFRITAEKNGVRLTGKAILPGMGELDEFFQTGCRYRVMSGRAELVSDTSVDYLLALPTAVLSRADAAEDVTGAHPRAPVTVTCDSYYLFNSRCYRRKAKPRATCSG